MFNGAVQTVTNSQMVVRLTDDILEMIAISIIRSREVNISNGMAVKIVNDFRNFVEAFPILFKSRRVCGYLSRTRTNDVLHHLNRLLFDDSRYPPIITNFGAIDTIGLSRLKTDSKEEFYNTQTIYVIYNMFYDFGIVIVKKIMVRYALIACFLGLPAGT